ncbi:MAG TPA: penicillin-binding protein 1C [Spirochaetales bacterium]|nr:penicillin-binding protein 1C [Spirochaetales bacterium]
MSVAALRGGAARSSPGRLLATLPPAAAALALAALFLWGPPRPLAPGSLSTALFDREGGLLGASVSAEGYWQFPPGVRLPDKFVRALLAYEDRRFLSHPGFDARSILRAALQNARAGRVVSGGSTLSMQAARITLPPGERRMGRKLAELALALRYELLLGKRGILELYAARAPFGGNVVGLEAASFRYFGRPPEGLSWAEAAALAVLPNAPSAAHPGKNRGLLLEKRNRLLRLLAARGELEEEDLGLALAEPLPPEPFAIPSLAPHLLDRARAEAAAAGLAGARVESTIDPGVQERAAALVERRAARLAASGVHGAACVVARVDTGEVLAYVGNAGLGADEDRGQRVDVVRSPRSSGSLLKPFLYAAALDSGEITPKALLADIPTRVGSYGPENNTGSYSGAVPAEEALARSLNVPFVRLLRSFGVERFRRLLLGTGMTTLTRPAEDYGLTLILGGAEITLWEAAGRYAALARTARGLEAPGGGQYFDLAYTREAASRRAARPDPFSPGAAWLTLEALLEVGRPEDEASWREFASARKVAWKTGTSFGFRDAWAVGLTSEYVVAVWAGNASGEGRPELRGSTAAAPLLFDLVAALPRSPWIPRPSSALEYATLCADSGLPAGPDCARTERVLLPAGAAAKADSACPYCRLVQLSADGAYRVTAEGERLDLIRTERRFVLPPAMEWYYRRAHLDYRPLPPWKPGTPAPAGGGGGLALLEPGEGASLYVPIELSGRPGAAVFSAVHRDSRALVFWHLDGEYLGSTRGTHRMEARPGPGWHLLSLVDEEGREAERRFEVLNER